MDGVALAPHRPVDVKDLDVDIYVCTPYSELSTSEAYTDDVGLLLVQSLRPTHSPTVRLISRARPNQSSRPFLQGNRDARPKAEPRIRKLRTHQQHPARRGIFRSQSHRHMGADRRPRRETPGDPLRLP